MIFLIKLLLSSLFLIGINLNSNASNLKLDFERNTINEHCKIIFEKSDNQLFKNSWKISKIKRKTKSASTILEQDAKSTI